MTTFIAVFLVVAVFAVGFIMIRRVTSTSISDMPETADMPDGSVIKTAVRAVKEAVSPPKPPSLRLQYVGVAVTFRNGDTHRGVIVGANRHATRFAIATRINGSPCVVKRRAKSISMYA